MINFGSENSKKNSEKLPQLLQVSSAPAHCRIGLGLPASSAPPEAGNPQL
jgi:hypothetical protein